jgi:hypothetical protein
MMGHISADIIRETGFDDIPAAFAELPARAGSFITDAARRD